MVLAKLIQAAEIEETDRVLIVGCTTGYSAAIVASLAGSVVALEEGRGCRPRPRRPCRRSACECRGGARAADGRLARRRALRRHPDRWGDRGYAGLDSARSSRRAAGWFACVAASPGRRPLLYRLIEGELSGRPIFDATAPLLPGFAEKPALFSDAVRTLSLRCSEKAPSPLSFSGWKRGRGCSGPNPAVIGTGARRTGNSGPVARMRWCARSSVNAEEELGAFGGGVGGIGHDRHSRIWRYASNARWCRPIRTIRRSMRSARRCAPRTKMFRRLCPVIGRRSARPVRMASCIPTQTEPRSDARPAVTITVAANRMDDPKSVGANADPDTL